MPLPTKVAVGADAALDEASDCDETATPPGVVIPEPREVVAAGDVAPAPAGVVIVDC